MTKWNLFSLIINKLLDKFERIRAINQKLIVYRLHTILNSAMFNILENLYCLLNLYFMSNRCRENPKIAQTQFMILPKNQHTIIHFVQ